MTFRKTLTAIALSLVLSAVAGCDSAKERAEKFYQSGLTYLEAGDIDRALVEFRNVFKLDGQHHDARLAYAEAERGRGRLREAFSQYLRLVEQYPDDKEGLSALAEIAAQSGDWPVAAKYSASYLEAVPDDLEIQAVKAAADYGVAAQSNDSGGVVAAAKKVRLLRDKLPGNILLRRVIIGDLLGAENFDEALKELNAAIDIVPDDRTFLAQRLSVYAALNDDAAVEAGLLDMVNRFSDAPEMGQALVRWYVARNQLDKAEDYLRTQIKRGDTDHGAVLNLVQFLAQMRGPEAAVAELERAIAAGDDALALRTARAGFLFDLGQKDAGIAEMQKALENAPPSEDEKRGKIGLARMLTATGNTVGARALVEEVLDEDAGYNEALKLKASWLIDDDEVGDAIAILRRAYDQDRNDASILTLMALAYERDGNRELMRESLSLAVVASNRAPEESLRYANLLASEDKLLSAEGVIIDALRLAPGTVSLLAPLGQIYVQVQDWPRAESVAAELEQIGDPVATNSAQGLRAAILAGRQNADQAIGYLQGLVDQGAGGRDTQIAILRAHLASGRNDKALAYSESLLAAAPDDPDLRFIDASVSALAGQTGKAEEIYRTLIAEDASRAPVWMALARLVASDKARVGEASDLVNQGLAVLPDSKDLKWAKAGFLERFGDIEGAIAIYEDLYKNNSASPVVANNLASLLSSYRSDPESIERAEVIARRLRGSTLAPYQDTYGWIAYLRGNYDDALAELEKAVSVLGDDPMVRYHLAKTYLALGRKSEALSEFRMALSKLDEGDSRDFVAESQAQVQTLEAEGIMVGN